MRVVAGSLGSRVLESAPNGVRPTGDRVRESLFGRLGDIVGCRVLDLYAGTGSLGIEALSRGAKRVTFVDRASTSLRVLNKNLANLEIESHCKVIRGEVRKVLRRLETQGQQFDLVFMDPPYDGDEYAPVLEQVADSELLAPHGMLVVESAKRHPLPSVAELSLDVVDERATGDTIITRLRSADGE